MKKYRLHNITNFGVEIHDFYTENSLNNYIALFVTPPYWVENLETNKSVYIDFTNINTDILDELDTFALNELGLVKSDNVSCETLHETPEEWISRHTPIEEKESYTKLEKISSFLSILSVIIMATLLLYFFLFSVSSIADYLASFNWKIFNIL